MAQLINYVYHRPGKGTVEYLEWLVLDASDFKVLLLDNYHGRSLQVGRQTILEPAAPIVWFIFPDMWYEIGRFHLADGTFTGWYTNLCTPVEMADNTWMSTDLFLDHWLSLEGEPRWLDEAEFSEAVRAGLLDDETVARVMRERSYVDSQFEDRNWPPRVTDEFDLEQAQSLKATT